MKINFEFDLNNDQIDLILKIGEEAIDVNDVINNSQLSSLIDFDYNGETISIVHLDDYDPEFESVWLSQIGDMIYEQLKKKEKSGSFLREKD